MERMPDASGGGGGYEASSKGLLAIELRDRLLLLRTSVLAPDNAVSVRGGTSDTGIGRDTEGPASFS